MFYKPLLHQEMSGPFLQGDSDEEEHAQSARFRPPSRREGRHGRRQREHLNSTRQPPLRRGFSFLYLNLLSKNMLLATFKRPRSFWRWWMFHRQEKSHEEYRTGQAGQHERNPHRRRNRDPGLRYRQRQSEHHAQGLTGDNLDGTSTVRRGHPRFGGGLLFTAKLPNQHQPVTFKRPLLTPRGVDVLQGVHHEQTHPNRAAGTRRHSERRRYLEQAQQRRHQPQRQAPGPGPAHQPDGQASDSPDCTRHAPHPRPPRPWRLNSTRQPPLLAGFFFTSCRNPDFIFRTLRCLPNSICTQSPRTLKIKPGLLCPKYIDK